MNCISLHWELRASKSPVLAPGQFWGYSQFQSYHRLCKDTINGDEQSAVDQNASFCKLFGFVNEKAKCTVNSYPTTPDYKQVNKPDVPNAGNILLIGQTFSFISKHVYKEYMNMECQIHFLFQIPQTTDMKSCITYLDPHTVSKILCYPSTNAFARTIFVIVKNTSNSFSIINIPYLIIFKER